MQMRANTVGLLSGTTPKKESARRGTGKSTAITEDHEDAGHLNYQCGGQKVNVAASHISISVLPYVQYISMTCRCNNVTSS